MGMGKPRTTLASLSREVVTEADAYRYWESLRWPDGARCPHCGGTEDVYLIVPENGVSRRTAAGTLSERRVWKCRPCKKQFSVLTGTIMHATKIPVRTWVLVMFDACSAKNGISAREVERKYGVCPKTAWHMLHRVRQAMAGGDCLLDTMRGTIVSDETWIGGKPSNRHGHKRGRGGQGVSDKTPVLALVNAVTGEVRTKVVPDVTGATLRKVIAEQVNMASSELWTDSANVYIAIGQEFASHQTVDHHAGQYVNRKGAGTNMAEGYFSQLKRSIDGTHHHVSREHLHRYCNEFAFRYTTSKASDHGRVRILARQMEGRLSYRRLVSTI